MTAFEGLSAGLAVAAEESKVTPGLLGFVVVALLGLATFLLVRSMNRQVRRIDLPDDPADDPADDPSGDPDGGTAAGPR